MQQELEQVLADIERFVYHRRYDTWHCFLCQEYGEDYAWDPDVRHASDCPISQLKRLIEGLNNKEQADGQQ